MSDSDSGDDMPDACSLRVPRDNLTGPGVSEVKPAKVNANREKTKTHRLQEYRTEGPVKAIFIHNSQYQPGTTLTTRKAFNADSEIVRNFLDLIKAELLEKENLDVKALRELLEELKTWDWERPRLVVVVLLAYGDGGQAMLTQDGQWLEVREVLQALQCPGLAGVPKLLLLNMEPLPETAPASLRRVSSTESDPGQQTVQGGEEDDLCTDFPGLPRAGPGHRPRPKSAAGPRKLRIPKEADVLQVVSEVTFGGGLAGKSAQGNHFLSALAENLLTCGGKMEVCQLLTRVNHQLSLALQQSAAMATQATKRPPPRRASFFVSTLTKELYLLPNAP